MSALRPPEPATLFVGRGWPGTRDFGVRLRRRRLELDKTAEQVAADAGVSAPFLRAVERGDRAPSEQTAVAVLGALEIAVKRQPTGFSASTSSADFAFDDPHTHQQVLVECKAARKGDSAKSTLLPLTEAAKQAAKSGALLQTAFGANRWPEFEHLLAVYVRTDLELAKDGADSSSDALRGRLSRRLATADEATLRLMLSLFDCLPEKRQPNSK